MCIFRVFHTCCLNFESYQTVGTLAEKPPDCCNVAPLEQTTFTTVILNAKDDTLAWSYQTGGAVISSPALANNAIYVGSHDHLIYAIGNPNNNNSIFQKNENQQALCG